MDEGRDLDRNLSFPEAHLGQTRHSELFPSMLQADHRFHFNDQVITGNVSLDQQVQVMCDAHSQLTSDVWPPWNQHSEHDPPSFVGAWSTDALLAQEHIDQNHTSPVMQTTYIDTEPPCPMELSDSLDLGNCYSLAYAGALEPSRRDVMDDNNQSHLSLVEQHRYASTYHGLVPRLTSNTSYYQAYSPPYDPHDMPYIMDELFTGSAYLDPVAGVLSPPPSRAPSPLPELQWCASSETPSTYDNSVGDDDSACDRPYAKLIHKAMMEAPDHRMSLRQIYAWFIKNTNKPKESYSNGWQNSIRHNLSMNQAFESEKTDVATSRGKSKKSSNVWVLTEEAILHGVQSTTRYRKAGANKKPSKSKVPPQPQRQRSGARGGRAARKAAKRKVQQQQAEQSQACNLQAVQPSALRCVLPVPRLASPTDSIDELIATPLQQFRWLDLQDDYIETDQSTQFDAEYPLFCGAGMGPGSSTGFDDKSRVSTLLAPFDRSCGLKEERDAVTAQHI